MPGTQCTTTLWHWAHAAASTPLSRPPFDRRDSGNRRKKPHKSAPGNCSVMQSSTWKRSTTREPFAAALATRRCHRPANCQRHITQRTARHATASNTMHARAKPPPPHAGDRDTRRPRRRRRQRSCGGGAQLIPGRTSSWPVVYPKTNYSLDADSARVYVIRVAHGSPFRLRLMERLPKSHASGCKLSLSLRNRFV